MNVLKYLKNNILFLDGALGTELQAHGLKAGESPELWNIENPELIRSIHMNYYEAGSNVICTNTFGATALKYDDAQLEKIYKSAFENAKWAKERSLGKQEKYIALDIGPSGKLLQPYGDFPFEDAVCMFAKQVRLGVKYGADLIFIETMSDCYETKAALLAAKENSKLPVFVCNAYGNDGKLMTGATPSVMATVLEGMGANAIGANCSFGPTQLIPVIEELLENTSLPVIFKPNAGLPKMVDGKTVFDTDTANFSETIIRLIKKGVRIAGGCCGTTRDYIYALTEGCKKLKPVKIAEKKTTTLCSYIKTVTLGDKPIVIGERINPTGKPRFKQALIEKDVNYILQEAINEQQHNADVLDVNVGIPDIDEQSLLPEVVKSLQSVTDLPLQIDTSDNVAMENALRIYNGKALINSVNGKTETMKKIFPIAKKYGGVIVCLTLDEKGIPKDAEGRLKIAKRIIRTADKYGISKKDLIFDPLAMTVSADTNAAKITLETVKLITEKTGCFTSLGISNVSFGLPERDIVNSTFLTLALQNGLSAAIINPCSERVMKGLYAYNMLIGKDENCKNYIANADNSIPIKETAEVNTTLEDAIIKGLKISAGLITEKLLKTTDAMDVINNMIIPALDTVGKLYEQQKVYLPQLLISAECAECAFEKIKQNNTTSSQNIKCKFVLATVKGDIHDIGKNIVKLLLQNYGYDVIDLGKDVPPKTIVDEVTRTHAELVGLSALMTTTVPAMEETVKLLKNNAPWCKIVVGGAVLNEEYANKMGADKYAKDAMETVRYAESVYYGDKVESSDLAFNKTDIVSEHEQGEPENTVTVSTEDITKENSEEPLTENIADDGITKNAENDTLKEQSVSEIETPKQPDVKNTVNKCNPYNRAFVVVKKNKKHKKKSKRR